MDLHRDRIIQEKMFANIGDVIVIVDKDGINQFKSANVEGLFGWKPEELVGKSTWENVHPEDQQTVMEFLHELSHRPNSTGTIECRYRCKEGQFKWIELAVANLLHDPDLCGYLGNYHDITERKRYEEALREAEWKFRALFEQGPIGVAYHKMIYDNAGKAVDYFFIDANHAYQELTGVDPRGMSVTEAFPGIEHDPFDWIGTFGEVARTGKTIRFEQHLEAVDAWYDCVAYQFRPDHFVAAFLNTTARKKAELELSAKSEALESMNEELNATLEELNAALEELASSNDELVTITRKAEAANEAKSQFLANMSHEIRTPMNGFMGMLQLLELTELTEEQQEYTRICRTASGSLLTLINDILDYSKIEVGRMDLEEVPVSLPDLMDDLISLFKPSVDKKKLTLEVSVGESVPEMVFGDPLRLKQVLSNLIGNAVKFTPHGHIGVDIEAVDIDEFDNVHLKFTVRDTGIGIEADKKTLLFERFSQIDSSHTRRHGGTGLGLAISKKLVEMMQGEIWVESVVGVGSIFSFTCRLKIQDPCASCR